MAISSLKVKQLLTFFYGAKMSYKKSTLRLTITAFISILTNLGSYIGHIIDRVAVFINDKYGSKRSVMTYDYLVNPELMPTAFKQRINDTS